MKKKLRILVLPGMVLLEAVLFLRHMHVPHALWCTAKGLYLQFMPTLLVAYYTACPGIRKFWHMYSFKVF